MGNKSDPKVLKKLRDKKIKKYMWVVEALAKKLKKVLPTNAQIEYQDLYLSGLAELTKQISRFYDNPDLLNKHWDDKKGDVTIGPFFLKGLNSPYPKKTDPGSIKYIKGAMMDELRKTDPAPRDVRNKIKQLDKYIREYTNALGRVPSQKAIKTKFGWSNEVLDEVLSYKSGILSRFNTTNSYGYGNEVEDDYGFDDEDNSYSYDDYFNDDTYEMEDLFDDEDDY